MDRALCRDNKNFKTFGTRRKDLVTMVSLFHALSFLSPRKHVFWGGIWMGGWDMGSLKSRIFFSWCSSVESPWLSCKNIHIFREKFILWTLTYAWNHPIYPLPGSPMPKWGTKPCRQTLHFPYQVSALTIARGMCLTTAQLHFWPLSVVCGSQMGAKTSPWQHISKDSNRANY